MSRVHLYVIALLMMSLVSVLAAGAARQDPRPGDAVRAFAEQVAREWPGETAQQAITVESLRLLAAAVRVVGAGQQAAIAADLKTLDERIEQFAANRPGSAEQTARLQSAFTVATKVLERLADASGVKEDDARRADAMARSADGLDLKQPLRRQPDVIERYFHQAAALLRLIDQHH